MIDSATQRPAKRKRMGPVPPGSALPGEDSEQALRSLEAYANQAEEALVVALDEVTLKDRRIAALEAELRAQKRPVGVPPASGSSPAAHSAVVLPTLSPSLNRSALQTRQALEAIGRHTGEANQALADLLAAAEEKEQGFEELQAQLHETRSDLEQQQQRSAAASQAAVLRNERQIAQLSEQQRNLQAALNEAQRQLSSREARITVLETELEQLRSSSEEQAQQLEQLHLVLEHYVLRCRELEHRSPHSDNGTTLGHANGHQRPDRPSSELSPLAQRQKPERPSQASRREKGSREASASPEPESLAAAPPPALT